ncbi:hypothetical protein GGI17_003714 [Coemansia sp. S146]|nr:hypothetical protein GGI17_003714 [Coemansia sp. S146]
MNRRPTEPTEPTERNQRLVQQRQQRQLQSMLLTNGGSPALTIDNDSFSSIRPHVMGHPGARVHPPLQYHATNAPPPQLSSRGDRQEISLRRRNESSPLGITRHNALHKQLLLVATPNPHLSQSLVGRLSVVRPSNDDIIVVEAKRSGSGPESPSVEAIYQVIGSNSNSHSNSMARVPPPPAPKTALSIDGRPIAIPKSRLGKLRPAQRNLPTSRQVVEAGPVYTRDGSFRARRPESIILMVSEEEPIAAAPEPPAIEISDSYCNDIGYDLANAEIDSLYCRSFDIDLLPDAPERKLSFYNIGVKDVPMRARPPPPDALSANEEEQAKAATDAPIESHAPAPVARPHRTLGIDNTGSPFALPNTREGNADFYTRMLAMRSAANPPPASPTSPAKTLPEPIFRRDSTASQQHRYHSQRRRSQRHSQRHRPRPQTPKQQEDETSKQHIEETPSQQVSTAEQQQQQQQVPASEKCIEMPSVDCLRIPMPRRVSSLTGHFFYRRRPKSAPSYEIRASGGEWSTANHARPAQPHAPAIVTEKIPAIRKSTTAATLPYTDSAASADRVLPPTHISSSSVRCEQNAQMRQRHLVPTLGAQPAQSPIEDDDKAGCGVACNSCWPTTNRQQRHTNNGDISHHSHYRQSRLAGGTGLLPSLASSWAHIYRSRPQTQTDSQGRHVGWRERRRVRHQNRSVRVRDVLAYPFQLGYNCLLWWLGPCVGLARECR